MKPSDVLESEYHAAYKQYIHLAADLEITESLLQSHHHMIDFFQNLPQDKLEYRYATGKWTPKEILQHLMDSERIFSYRALTFARKDNTPIPGFEQDDYIVPSKANRRTIEDLLAEYKTIRQSSISLFKSFDKEMWLSTGTACDNVMSARAAASLLSGHELHHIQVIKERYL